ncbi:MULTISPECIES: hypothetical protein [Aeromonas]|uniref:Magnesium transporter n=1 Tax=Aeromonas allosaccharophila TaxID=656 RepID=A0AAX3NM54_9GAMM|nr:MULTISPECIES: hypothetical protein [Aeromonas]MBS4694330.1 hypothetical protein [Aeromonas allosaccharophila]TNJ24197.1 hypothetical protein CF111_08740 [Aeromonas sobria]WED75239.1 hypothetical protein PYU98_14970 [Aeromonas allosaccharophila]
MSSQPASALARWLWRLAFILVTAALVIFFSKGASIYPVDAAQFSHPLPAIMVLLDSEIFMGVITVITLYVVLYLIHLLWQLHEIAVHRAKLSESVHITLVFALSLCGLFIDKTWWVLAIIIAFARWDVLAERMSQIIGHGIRRGRHQGEPS